MVSIGEADSSAEEEALIKAIGLSCVIKRSDPAFYRCDSTGSRKLVSKIEESVAQQPMSPGLRAAIERWLAAVSPRPLTPEEERQLGEASAIAMEENDRRPWEEVSVAFARIEQLNRIRNALTDERKLIARLTKLLSGKGQFDLDIDGSDAVGTAIAADVAEGKRASGSEWVALLLHTRTLSSSAPSQKWLKEAARLAEKIKSQNFGDCVSDWLNQAGKPASAPVTIGEISDATLFNDCSVDILKGLAWTIVAAKRGDLSPALGNLAEASFKKVANKGPRNVKVGNAAVAALAALADPSAAAQLSRLRLRVKHASSRNAIDKALATASEKTGLSPDDLAEISVPTFGLDADGIRRTEFGEASSELRVVDSHTVELGWLAKGKLCGSVPAVIRKEHADELKRLKREANDASIMLAAQALRLERSFIFERTWSLKDWRERFLNHPLVGTLARRLIWQFDDVLAIPHNGEVVDADDGAFAPKTGAVVSLWHPLRSTPAQVLAWREWLERHEVVQPFKQAHREIYLLTDAERSTGSYSNRFAAHILRQHQFAALCQQRGWEYRLQGQFDSHNSPTLRLPALAMNPQFWVEPVEGEVTPRGIFVHLSSDQVRFGRSLTEVPPTVFSEVMRDVDLFVSVTGVSNDPAWQDGGPEGRDLNYWRTWSFGELLETAKVRKEILTRLIPKLAIAGQCSIEEKFLVVKGSLRTYKIHFGSGNILMEPNNQYLCIVPDNSSAQKRGEKVFLPFEGDRTLSVILSKAFLLAEDTKIKDQTILRQITRA